MSRELQEAVKMQIQAIINRRLASFQTGSQEGGDDPHAADATMADDTVDSSSSSSSEDLSVPKDASRVPVSEKSMGKRKAIENENGSEGDLEPHDDWGDEWGGIDDWGGISMSLSGGTASEDEEMDDVHGTETSTDIQMEDLTQVSAWSSSQGPSAVPSRAESPELPEDARIPRTPQVGQRRDRDFFSGGSGEKQPKRTRQSRSSFVDDFGTDNPFISSNKSQPEGVVSQRNTSLSTRFGDALSLLNDPVDGGTSSSSIRPPVPPSPSASGLTNDASNIQLPRQPSAGPRINIFASYPEYRPPVQGPRPAPVDPRTIFFPAESASTTVQKPRTVPSTSHLAPAFQFKPATTLREKPQRFFTRGPSPVRPPDPPKVEPPPRPPSIKHRFPSDLPPSDPPTPASSDEPFPIDDPQASPPAGPEDQHFFDDNHLLSPPNLPSTQALRSRSRSPPRPPSALNSRQPMHSDHSAQGSRNPSPPHRDQRGRPTDKLSSLRNAPGVHSASTSQPAVMSGSSSSRIAPGASLGPASQPSAGSSSRHVPGANAEANLPAASSSRPTLSKPYPRPERSSSRDSLSPPPAEPKSDNPYKTATATKKYAKKKKKI
ncbi:hypothetical protein GALMADRAFT_148844 [Galerina marginata CBS 339.88]|uniref:Uncharacterized protein n=1 Tax=Galerina marginata (strain CBS 339.88) TaxID=685588 RepID=A0A067S349_GALM3|nr:hypothetical protein GALMADRAFT_148844 [Galerina marginata CBS 339.88]